MSTDSQSIDKAKLVAKFNGLKSDGERMQKEIDELSAKYIKLEMKLTLLHEGFAKRYNSMIEPTKYFLEALIKERDELKKNDRKD